MRKKLLAIVVAVFMAATVCATMTGCSKDNAKVIKIVLLTNTQETEVYKNYFDDLEAQLKEEGLDYEIDFTGLQEKDYYDTLGSLIQQNAVPDIFYVRPNELMQYQHLITSLQSFAENQDYADLSNIYEVALDMYRYNPSTGVLGNHDDDLYAFPKDLSTQQLGYNVELLTYYQQYIRDAGIEKLPWEMGDEPYTWAEYKTMCQAIADAFKAGHKPTDYSGEVLAPSDVPDIEILAKSFSSNKSANVSPLIDLTGGRASGTVNSLTEGAMQKAIKYQAELVACGAADYTYGTYANMTAGKVCFYGAIGSWEVAEYNDHLGDGKWELMPWPVETKGDTWQGLIKSAGYVVSQKCANMAKGDTAKRVAISFLSASTQRLMYQTKKISLPLLKDKQEDYVNPDNDEDFAPKSRKVFMDVISGAHGFYPAEYSTFDTIWKDELDTQLAIMWKKGSDALTYFNSPSGSGSYSWSKLQERMQAQYNETKNS